MIGVLTYDVPHRKTQDLLFRLKAFGYDDIIILALPFDDRPIYEPIYQHRPISALPIQIDIFCKNLSYEFCKIKRLSVLGDKFECLLIGGANIIQKEYTEHFKIINSHPGYLPYARGLDALKWAIYNEWPIGCTAHIINGDIDAGILIKQRKTPLYPRDTFYSFAMRHYELEIELLIDAISEYKIATKPVLKKYPDIIGVPTKSIVYKRMPHDKEIIMMKRFEKRITENNYEANW